MNLFRTLLVISSVAIYVFTVIAIVSEGWNWPAVAINDLLALDWRTQFDFDFIIHLLLLATWVVWREGANTRAYVFGFLSIVMGGMFSFPYILLGDLQSQSPTQSIALRCPCIETALSKH